MKPGSTFLLQPAASPGMLRVMVGPREAAAGNLAAPAPSRPPLAPAPRSPPGRRSTAWRRCWSRARCRSPRRSARRRSGSSSARCSSASPARRGTPTRGPGRRGGRKRGSAEIAAGTTRCRRGPAAAPSRWMTPSTWSSCRLEQAPGTDRLRADESGCRGLGGPWVGDEARRVTADRRASGSPPASCEHPRDCRAEGRARPRWRAGVPVRLGPRAAGTRRPSLGGRRPSRGTAKPARRAVGTAPEPAPRGAHPRAAVSGRQARSSAWVWRRAAGTTPRLLQPRGRR